MSAKKSTTLINATVRNEFSVESEDIKALFIAFYQDNINQDTYAEIKLQSKINDIKGMLTTLSIRPRKPKTL